MQFDYSHKVGENYCLITLDKTSYDKLPRGSRKALCNSFSQIGGYINNSDGDYKIRFPAFITSEVISEIVKNTCFVCGGLMQDEGIALQNKWVSFDDFGNDAGQPGTTMSQQGPAVVKKVRKCQACGHNHT